MSVAESQTGNFNQIFSLLDPKYKNLLLKQAEKTVRPSVEQKVKIEVMNEVQRKFKQSTQQEIDSLRNKFEQTIQNFQT